MKKRPLRRFLKWALIIFLLLFGILNWVAYNHARKFTHSDPSLQGQHPQGQVYKMAHAPFWEKLGYAFWGISVPKSQNKIEPDYEFETLWFVGKDSLEGWLLETEEDSKGIVTLWHGYGASKAQLIANAYWFLKQGYDCLLVDFPAHGGSTGTTVTIGWAEAESVKLVNEWLKKTKPEAKRLLFGSSMGSVAILKAAAEYDLGAEALILECPFASLRHAINKRFELMKIPAWGMPDLLMFWGGAQHGFWAYKHSSLKYAEKVKTPTLILYGEQDPKVDQSEVENILKHLAAENKMLKTLPCAEHNYLISSCPELWPETVSKFLDAL